MRHWAAAGGRGRLAGARVAPVFAQVGDGDGLDGDELVLPLVLVAAIVISGVAYWRSRRSQGRVG